MNKHKKWIEQLSNSPHIGILVVDKERNNLFVNPHLCEMFGYEKEFLLQQSAEIFHVNHDSYLKFADLAFNAVSAGTPLGIDYKFKRNDGSYFWAHIAGDPIKLDNGVLWTLVDITQKILAQKNIKKLNERMELALLGNNDGIWDWNLQTNKVYYSPRWKEMLGYRDDELPNKFSVWEEHVHPKDKEMVLEKVQQNIDGQSEYVDVYHRLKHKDGHWVWIHNRSKTIAILKQTSEYQRLEKSTIARQKSAVATGSFKDF